MSKIFIPSSADIKVCSMIVEAAAANPKEKLVLIIDGKKFKLSDQMAKDLLRLVAEVSKGNSVSIEATGALMTTQEAADYLGYSRPTLIKLLDEYKVPISKVGRHRRVSFDEVASLEQQIQVNRQQAIRDLQKLEVELGLLDIEE
jgi:excisionase family DNA binding protein